MIRAMTLWEAVSVFRAEPEALDEVFGSDQWRPAYFPLYQRVAEAVRVNDRALLDTRLPTELTREVAARCHTLRFLYDPGQRVLHVAGCPTLLRGEQLEMTALEVHDRWGGSIMEEVLEFGSASVAADPAQEGFTDSTVSVAPRLVPLSKQGSLLYLACSGVYRLGSAGKPDALQIYEVALEWLRNTDATALMLDYTDLDYQWGDDLWLTFQIDHPRHPARALPFAVIVGARCQAAIKSLLEADGGFTAWLEAGFVFLDEASAIAYLAQAVDRLA